MAPFAFKYLSRLVARKSPKIILYSPFAFKSLGRLVLRIALFSLWVAWLQEKGEEEGKAGGTGTGGGDGRGGKTKGRGAKSRGGKGSQSLYTCSRLPIARTCGKYW